MLLGTMRPAYILFTLLVISQPLLIEGCVPARLDNSNGLASPLELVPFVAVNSIPSPVPAKSETPVATHSSIPSLAVPFKNVKSWQYLVELDAFGQRRSSTAEMTITDITNDIATAKVVEATYPTSQATFRFKLTGELISSDGQVLPPDSVTVETLKVPAGSFSCMKIGYDIDTANQEARMSYWIDSEVGIVKFVPVNPNISYQSPTIVSMTLQYIEKRLNSQ